MIRAYVIHLNAKPGQDPPRATVTFDKYGQNSAVFDGRTDEQALNQACSNAVAAVIHRYGPDWLNDYSVTTV